jgi:hypothetical protein
MCSELPKNLFGTPFLPSIEKHEYVEKPWYEKRLSVSWDLLGYAVGVGLFWGFITYWFMNCI